MLTKNEWNVVQCLEDTKVLDMIYIFKKNIPKYLFFNNKKSTMCDTLNKRFSSVSHGDKN